MLSEQLHPTRIEIGPPIRSDTTDLREIMLAVVRDRVTKQPEVAEINQILRYMLGYEDLQRHAKRKYLIAREVGSGIAIGCIGWSVPDNDMVRHFEIADTSVAVEALNFFVSPHSQGLGVGRKLFNQMVRRLKESGKKILVANSGPRYKPAWESVHDKLFGVNARCGFIYGKYGADGGDAMTWRMDLN